MKIDTPVATMGIRGTAVLVEIDFDTAGQNGLPDTKFQVLVEPDGTTGSYILFDKVTLTPFAVVDRAGTQFSFSNGNFSQSLTGLTPEVQKLITDVFAQKFTDNSNPRTFDHHTDTPIPDSFSPFKVGNVTVTPVILLVNAPVNTPAPAAIGLGPQIQHIDGPPGGVIVNANGQASTDFRITEIPGVTGSHTPDKVSGAVNFVDINAGDQPTVSAKFDGSAYTDPHGHALSLNAQQLADIKAVEVDLVVTATPGNNNNGSASWSYTVPDGSFDFLAAGETLQLTYTLTVDNNYAPHDESTPLKFTITITGTNDVPVITTAAQTINFSGGKTTVGGDLAPTSETSGVSVNHPSALSYSEKGTLSFTDPDLTDTHSIVVPGQTGDLTGASLAGVPLDLAAFQQQFPLPFQIFENALSASIGTDSTGTGTGTINWTFAELPAYVADFIPSGETLTLTYTVEVKDSQGAISTQTITVTVTGNDTPAVVWKDVAPAPPSGALWSNGANWGTGNAPTIADDTIIITNQLQPNTPTYPVVIDSAASAKSLVMDDPAGLLAPELDNKDTLTIAGGLNMSADAILKNFGTLSVGSLAALLSISGLAEFSDHSVLNNSGTIKLAQGGDFLDHSSITNSGTIEISGDKLNVEVAIANAGGTIQVDDGTTLVLSGATVTGGTINNGTASGTVVDSGTVLGLIDVTGNSKINGNAILNHGDVTTESGVTLTLDNVTVNGTTFADTASGTIIQIDNGTVLTLSGTTINGGTVNDGTAGGTGGIDVIGPSTISNAFLNHGGVTIASGVTLTLNNDTVTGTIFTDVDNAQVESGGSFVGTIDISGAVTFQGGVSVNGGAMSIAKGATLDIEIAVTGTGATLNGVDVMNSGTIQVDGPLFGATIINLVLDGGTTVTGGTLLIHVGFPIGSVEGTVEIGAGGATFDHVTVLNNNSMMIDDGDTLTLSQVTINGGTINRGTAAGAGGTIDVAGDSSINGSTIDNGEGTTTVDAILNNGGVTIENGVTLTLDNVTVNGTIFTGLSTSSTIQVDDGDTLTLNGTAINNDTIITTGTLDLENATINGGTLGGAGTITTATGNTDSTLNGVTIASGTVVTAAVGTLDLTGTITNNGEIDATTGKVNVTGNITGTGSIDVFDNGTLEIGGSVSSGETVIFGAKGGPVATAATVILDDSHQFGGTIVGLTANPSESLENLVDLKDLTFIPGDMHISIISGGLADGLFEVSNGIDFVDLHLSGVSSGTFEFATDATGGTLLDDAPASGTVTIDSGKTLDISAASTATVSFTNGNGNTGELVLDNSKDFTGQILGFAGDGTTSNSDLIKLTDVSIADVAMNKTTYTDDGNGTGTLILHNANGQVLDSLTFAGSYQLANFIVESDGAGHTLIVDPPVSSGTATVGNSATTGIASVPNQKLSGLAASDTFVFNFTGVGHATVTDFHPATDALQFSNPIFASALAALHATHGDDHGHTGIAIDAHDTITLDGVLKAQLHASDFHIV